MGARWWFLSPLYWILAALPLMAAFWVFQQMPETIQVTPELSVPTNRAGVWPVPILNACFAVALHLVAGRMEGKLEDRFRALGRTSDAATALPILKIFMILQASAACLALVYGYYVMDASLGQALMGRIAAFLFGLGLALYAIRLPHVTMDNLLALRFPYTEKSTQVWLKTHKLGSKVLYAAGAIMVTTAFLSSGVFALTAVFFILFLSLLALYLYAKRLYEDEFRP